MYSRITIALVVVGLLVGGFGIFNSSVSQAAPPCIANSGATLAANPELLKISCIEVSVEAETNGQRGVAASAARYSAMADYYAGIESDQQRANEAHSARYTGLAEFYTGVAQATSSSYQAANPELLAVSRYQARVEWQRKHFPGR